VEYKRFKENPKLSSLDLPGEELQIDGSYPYGRARRLVAFSAIDDCSRFVYSQLYDRETAKNLVDFIKELIRRAPFRILYVRVDNKFGQELRLACFKLGI
jgi:hypothetical protein